MKIISWNVNGIRAVEKKGFSEWFKKENPDVLCLQEVKAQDGQIPKELMELKNYYSFFNFAQKKGYSGVAVFTKQKPVLVKNKIGLKRFDEEGRILYLEYKNIILINLYLPHGGRQKENLPYKLEVYKNLLKYFSKIKNKKVILLGDFNIAHQDIDLARPKNNKNNIMFTPEERANIDKILNFGFVDTFRHFNKIGGNYTWWPYFASARARNLGWRIDYVFVSKLILKQISKAFILPDVFGSDHCPVGIEIK
jgi:exodeoxyribonuclease-3